MTVNYLSIQDLPHPWYIMEDSHVNMVKVFEYFDEFTKPGDYICVEDTHPDVPSDIIPGLVKKLVNTEVGPAKLNALKKFLAGRSDKYLVDQRYTDFFG